MPLPLSASPVLFTALLLLAGSPALAERQSLSDAWWTGPLAAAGAETLPPGHVLIEPYLFDVMTGNSRTPGSSSYLLYGVAPRFTAGVLPSFSYAKDVAGERHLAMGDLTLNFQYRLTPPNPRRTFPSVALNIQTTLPTARFDRLRTAGSGAGSGVFSTTVGLYLQQYFWLPNGRILRARLDVSRSFTGIAHVHDISIYGTARGFRGTAKPGETRVIDLAAEYSITKKLVVALDALDQSDGPIKIETSAPIGSSTTPSSRFFALIPALEYNWSSNEGVIVGTRKIFRGHHQSSSITPVIAFNRYF